MAYDGFRYGADDEAFNCVETCGTTGDQVGARLLDSFLRDDGFRGTVVDDLVATRAYSGVVLVGVCLTLR